MARSLTRLATISAAILATSSLSASADTGHESAESTASAQVDEAASANPEAAPAPKAHQKRKRKGEVFSDFYIGAAITSDAPYKVDGITQDPGVLCGAQCGTAKSPVGGLRVGYFFERFAWLGVAGDISYLIQAWGIQSAYEITTIPISALVMFRAPLIRSPEHPNGRAQPYMAVGPSLVVSTAELATGWAFLGTGHVHTDRSVDPGVDARFGMRLIASDWISVALEYRFTWLSPTWQIEGHRVETSLRTNHFNIGLGIHY